MYTKSRFTAFKSHEILVIWCAEELNWEKLIALIASFFSSLGSLANMNTQLKAESTDVQPLSVIRERRKPTDISTNECSQPAITTWELDEQRNICNVNYIYLI